MISVRVTNRIENGEEFTNRVNMPCLGISLKIPCNCQKLQDTEEASKRIN
jgi:hypothetical protein